MNLVAHYIRLARPQQWHKNGVVLAALLFAGRADHVEGVRLAAGALVIFALLSSGLYVINDLIDRHRDKLHYLKRSRPIASGKIGLAPALVMAILLIGAGLAGAWTIGQQFTLIALLFLSLNLLYSAVLKEIVIVDVMSIALSFVLRAYAGAVAIEVPASKWLIITTLLLALFLGFGKRRHELLLLENGAAGHRRILGQYSPYLLDQCIGVTTASVVVMYMLYTFSPEVSSKLGTDNLYLTIPFVIYGIFRYLFLIHRRDEGGSPSKVMIDDKPILLTVFFWLMTVVLVLYWS